MSGAGSGAGLGPIGQIGLRVHDVDRATAFYRDKLGLRHLFGVPGRMAFFDCDGVRLMLSIPEGPAQDHPGSILYFKVADIEAAHAGLVAGGVEILEPPRKVADMPDHALWMAFFRDPDGNPLALMCERRR